MSFTCERRALSPSTTCSLHVEAEHPVARLGELDRQRQPDVPEPDDAEQQARGRSASRDQSLWATRHA